MNEFKNIKFDDKESNVKSLLLNSTYQILNFKKDLYKLYKIIFEFCDKNKIIISNFNININNIQEKNHKLIDLDNDFKFHLFSTNPYLDAIQLTNKLFQTYSKYVVMSSYLRNKEIIISIDNNRVIQFQLLFLFEKNIELLKNIKYESSEFKFDNNTYQLYYSTALFELLQLTHILYNPSNFLKFYKENNKLSLIFSQLIDIILLNSNKNKLSIINKKSTNSIFIDIRKYLIENIYIDSYSEIKCIILDNIAINSILNNDIDIDINQFNYNHPLHILINSNFLELILIILNNYIKTILDNKKYVLINKTNIIYISNDFRLIRKNISLLDKETGNKSTIIYIYNSLDYEVIPTIIEKKTLYIPHPLVVIRFLIINLYYIQLFDSSYNQYTYNNFLQNINSLMSLKEIYYIKKYNKINYLGIYIDERIDKFKLKSSIYRPWQYQLKNNKLLN